MRRATAALSAALVLAAFVSPASAKTISDPKEGVTRDIHYTKLVRPVTGKLAWTVITYDQWQSSSLAPLAMRLFLDTKGTSGAEFEVRLYWDSYYKKLMCQLERPSGDFVASAVAARPGSRTATCVFPTKAMTLEKAIHWRVESESIGGPDKAPDAGWIVGVG